MIKKLAFKTVIDFQDFKSPKHRSPVIVNPLQSPHSVVILLLLILPTTVLLRTKLTRTIKQHFYIIFPFASFPLGKLFVWSCPLAHINDMTKFHGCYLLWNYVSLCQDFSMRSLTDIDTSQTHGTSADSKEGDDIVPFRLRRRWEET